MQYKYALHAHLFYLVPQLIILSPVRPQSVDPSRKQINQACAEIGPFSRLSLSACQMDPFQFNGRSLGSYDSRQCFQTIHLTSSRRSRHAVCSARWISISDGRWSTMFGVVINSNVRFNILIYQVPFNYSQPTGISIVFKKRYAPPW